MAASTQGPGPALAPGCDRAGIIGLGSEGRLQRSWHARNTALVVQLVVVELAPGQLPRERLGVSSAGLRRYLDL